MLSPPNCEQLRNRYECSERNLLIFSLNKQKMRSAISPRSINELLQCAFPIIILNLGQELDC